MTAQISKLLQQLKKEAQKHRKKQLKSKAYKKKLFNLIFNSKSS